MVKMSNVATATAKQSSSVARATLPQSRVTGENNERLESHFVSFNGNQIHYATTGTGNQTVVLVHCWAGNLGFWRQQVPVLASKARLVLIDLPGHGRSGRHFNTYSMDYFAEAVLAVMRDARVDKATMIGHSMGGPVIYRVYEKAPEKVAALVVMDAFLRRPQIPADQAEQFIAPFRTPQYREYTKQFFGAMFPTPGTEALRDQVLSEMLDTPQDVMRGAMEGMFGLDQPDWALKDVKVPLLVINSKGQMWDALDGEGYVRSLAAQMDYHAMESIGHWLMLERPAEFNAILTGMLHKFNLIAN